MKNIVLALILILGIGSGIHGQGKTNDSTGNGLRIFVNNLQIASYAQPVEDFSAVIKKYGYLELDSISFGHRNYNIYYKTDNFTDSLVFITDKKLPSNIRVYYERKLKRASALTGAELKRQMAKDFIYPGRMNYIIENGKNILVLKGRYHPPGNIEAGLNLDTREGKLNLTGIVRMNLNNIFYGNDKIDFNYQSVDSHQKAVFAYLLKYPSGLPFHVNAAWDYYKTDTLSEMRLSMQCMYQTGGWLFLSGVERVQGRWYVRDFMVFGAGYENRSGKNFWSLKWGIKTEKAEIYNMKIHSIWRRNSNLQYKVELISDRLFKTGNLHFVKYYDVFTVPAFLHIDPRHFVDMKMTISLVRNHLIFYGSSRFLQIFSTHNPARYGIINALGIGLPYPAGKLSLEFAYNFKKNYPADYKGVIFIIKQAFQW
jgi:hypothetical protein